MNIVETDGANLARTNIATHHFSNLERLLFAIYDDDATMFDKMGIPLEDLAKIELDDGANVLNMAIDQERLNIILHLADLTKHRPEIREKLLTHQFG